MNRAVRVAAWIAALLFAGCVIAFGSALEGYSQALHPVALLGAQGVTHAQVFNLLGFVLPGLLLAFVGWRLREAQPADAPWPPRIGAWLVMLSALAFAMQGVLHLDPRDLEAVGSRLHASAWTLWWVAFAAGAILIAIGRWRGGNDRLPAWTGVLAATVLVMLALLGPLAMPAAIAQRAAFAVWFLWWLALARAARQAGSVA